MLHAVLLVKSTDYPSFVSHFLIFPIVKTREVRASKDYRKLQVLSKQLICKCQNGFWSIYLNNKSTNLSVVPKLISTELIDIIKKGLR